MKLTPGSRWKSAVCDTEAVIVRPPREAGALECGGAPMVSIKDVPAAGIEPDMALMGGSLLGKRYADDAHGIEVLCTKPGRGTLTFAGAPLTTREAKKLPSSD